MHDSAFLSLFLSMLFVDALSFLYLSPPANTLMADCAELPHKTLEPQTTLNPFWVVSPQTTESPQTTDWPSIVEPANSVPPQTTDSAQSIEPPPHTTEVSETI